MIDYSDGHSKRNSLKGLLEVLLMDLIGLASL